MEIEIKQADLKNALSIIMRAAAARSSLAILRNVRLEAKANVLVLSGTNLDFSLTSKPFAMVSSPGETTVNAKLFYEVVNSLNCDKVQIGILPGSTELYIKGERNESRIKTIPADEFPIISEFPDEYSKIDAGDFTHLVESVIYAAAKDEYRPALSLNFAPFKLNREQS